MKSCTNPQCSRQIPDDAGHCPYCGRDQAKSSRSGQPFYLIGIVMLSLALILFLKAVSPQTASRNSSLSSSKESALITSQTPIATRNLIFASPSLVPKTKTPIPVTETPAGPTRTSISTSTSCAGAPPTRIKINDLVIVITTDRDRLVLRSLPEINDSTEIQRLETGTQLKIFDGPVCVKDPKTAVRFWFWQVRVKATRQLGWVAEGDRSLYYLEVVR